MLEHSKPFVRPLLRERLDEAGRRFQAALAERARTGRGQMVDLALFDCLTGVLANQAMNYLVSGTAPRRMGNAHPNIVPYQLFPASDGHLIVACGNDRQFAALCRVLDLPDLPADPDFATNPARVAHRDRLVPALDAALAGWETRVSTGQLNSFLGRLVAEHPHPVRSGKQPRVLFGTQASTAPPTFVLFTSGPLEASYLRFVERRLREEFGFTGSPIHLQVRPRKKDGARR